MPFNVTASKYDRTNIENGAYITHSEPWFDPSKTYKVSRRNAKSVTVQTSDHRVGTVPYSSILTVSR